MTMTNQFTALTGILAPGTGVYGYHRGAPVSAQVVESWGLVVGDANDPEAQVVAGDLPDDTPVAVAVPQRPADEAPRAAWESWAIANGATEAEAAEMAMEDLQAVVADPPKKATAPERPADSAPKPDWVAYAIKLGADETWARDSATTKANLQAYEPPIPGDTVAVAATEANQG